MYTLIIHVANAEPVKVDVDELPNPTDQFIVGRNPRERNDKEFEWVNEGVTTVFFPWWRINFVQVLPSEGPEEEIELFYRD
jgi:hypothetical protein